MKITKKIIIDANPEDISKALVEVNKIPPNYSIKEFTYTLTKIKEGFSPDMERHKITHCKLVLLEE